MLDQTRENERSLLACLYADGANIDRCLQSGLGDRHFAVPEYAEQFRLLCAMRGAGSPIDSATVYAEAYKNGLLKACGGVDSIMAASDLLVAGTSLGFHGFLQVLLDAHTKREAYRVAQGLLAGLKAQSLSVEDIRGAGERIVECAAPVSHSSRSTEAIADEAIQRAQNEIAGRVDTRLIEFGLPKLDRYFTPVRRHEYVVIPALRSHGKSSFMVHMASHNLARGKRIAYFPLETSDTAVVEQIAAQRSKVSLRFLRTEMPARQKAYVDELNKLKREKGLLVFEKDITLTAIEARCRLLAQSFQPDAVFIDYLNIIRESGDLYERLSMVSNRMIELRKALGCPLIVAAQLGREVEKQNRPPILSDMRDCGTIENDAHRVVAIWWKNWQQMDLDYREYEVFQLKLRDGPVSAANGIRFHAPTTTFFEEQGSTH